MGRVVSPEEQRVYEYEADALPTARLVPILDRLHPLAAETVPMPQTLSVTVDRDGGHSVSIASTNSTEDDIEERTELRYRSRTGAIVWSYYRYHTTTNEYLEQESYTIETVDPLDT